MTALSSGDLWTVVGLTAAVVNLVISFLVYVRKDYEGYRAFAGLSLCLSLWHFCHVLVYPDYVDPFWMRVLFSSLAFIPAFTVQFIGTLLEAPRFRDSARWWAPAGAAVLVSIWTPYFSTNSWHILFVFFEFPILLFSLVYLFIATVRERSIERRNGLIYLCVASGIAIAGGFSEFLPRFGVPIPSFPFASASIAVYVLLVAYAIRRHQLLDIRSAIHRGLALGGLALLVGAFCALLFYLARVLPSRSGAMTFLFFYLSSVMTLLFWERWGEKLKELVFSEERLRARRTEDWMRSLPRMLALEEFLDSARRQLVDETKAKSCSVLLCDARARMVDETQAKRLGELFARDRSPTLSMDLRWRLRDSRMPEEERAQLETLADLMTERGAQIAVPVIAGESPQAVFMLSERQTQGFYDAQLLSWLSWIGTYLGQALADFQVRQGLLDADRLVQLGLLSGGIAHEIRNPLNYMKGAVSVLETTDLTGEQKSEIMKSLEKEIERLNRLADDLLSFAKPHRRQKTSCDIATELNDIVKIVKPNLDYPMQLEWRKPEAPIPAPMDSDHLKQIVLNLIRNAQLAMTEAKQGDRIMLETSSDGAWACIRVADNGPGIPKEVATKLFQVFASGSSGGTGFGLNIVDKLVRLYRGQISVDSEQGKGTAFTIRIPTAA